MSGESESKKQTIEERHKKVEELLYAYPAKIGLGLLKPINEVNRYLVMSSVEQRRLTAEECGEAGVILNQAATYIQLELNRTLADIKWCNNYTDWLIAGVIANYGSKYTPFDYRRLLAIKDNDITKRLYEIIANAELKAQSLEYMPTQLKGTASSFAGLQQTKRSQRA